MKPFWQSRVFWTCIAGAAVIIGQWIQGSVWVPVGIQGAIGVVITLVLRLLTDQGISLPGASDDET